MYTGTTWQICLCMGRFQYTVDVREIHPKWLCDRRHSQEFCSGGGSTNSVEDRGQRERGSGGGSPLVRGSGGSCNLVQEISFHTVKFS